MSKDKNKIIFLINTTKKRLDELTSLISEMDNKAFITVKETRTIINGYI